MIDRTRATVKDLHSRVRVAIQAVDSISRRIEKLRDEELQPQLLELIQGYDSSSSTFVLFVSLIYSLYIELIYSLHIDYLVKLNINSGSWSSLFLYVHMRDHANYRSI